MKRILQALLLLTISLVCGSVVLEITARAIVGSPLPEQLPLVRVKADKDAGWVMLPNDSHYTYDKKVQLNSLGFRGPEPGNKQENEYRIIALGDSHIYGQGLQDDALLTTVLADELNTSQQACHYNVINMGVRAYSINNEIAVEEIWSTT